MNKVSKFDIECIKTYYIMMENSCHNIKLSSVKYNSSSEIILSNWLKFVFNYYKVSINKCCATYF